MSTKTKAPTGLKVSRNGRKFKFEWTQKADYDKQQIAYSYNTANAFAAGMWADIGKNAKSYTITLPSLDKGLTKFVFKVRGKVNNKDWSSATSINVISKLKEPHTPSASMALTSKYSSTFSWTTDTKPTDMRPFDHVVRQTKLIKDCTVNTKAGFEKLTGWDTDGDDLGANDSKPYSETTAVVAGKSYTRVVRVKAVGAYGSSKWDYAWHVYADSYAATNLKAEATKDLDKNIFTGYATWTGKKNAAHPIDKVIPQYVMAVPDEGMQCPDVQFNNLPEQKDTSDDATAFVIDSLLAKDQCLFFRILHKRDGDNRDVPSLPVLVGKDGTGYLKDPIFTQAPDKQTTSARVYAENKSEVPDSFLVITYQDDNYEEYDIGIITGDNEYTDVIYPANPSNPKFGVYAVVATATYEEREDGGDQYEISNVKMRSENTLHEAGTVVKVPQNLKLTQTTKNALLVEWDWIWDGIEGIEISWSENEEAWESNEEPEVHTVKKINPNRLYLLGLDTGKRWYVRARFIKNEADESYGNYTETEWLDLVTAPAIPELELSKATMPKGDDFTASWVYVSTDGQEQKSAIVYEVPANAQSEDDYIKVAEAEQEQSVVISTANNPVASTWNTGTTHNLVVRVISESDKTSEFSNSEPIAIAEPVECEIEDTNLVEDSVPVNPESYTGNPITFDTGEQEKEVASLNVSLLPVQDLHGYDKPWSAGAGKNKVDIASGSITVTTNLLSKELSAGTYTFSAYGKRDDNGSWRVLVADQSDVAIAAGNEASGSSIMQSRVTFTLTETATLRLKLQFLNSYDTLRYERLQLELGSTATAWTPYTNICPITAPTTSKNKIPYPYILGSNTVGGITYTDNGDGTLTINGTATTLAFYDLGNVSRNYFELPAGTYTFAGSGNAGVDVTLCKIVNGVGHFFKKANTTAVTFTTAETASYYFYVVVNSGTTVNNLIVKPQLEEGAVATPFRPKGENVQVKQTAKNLLDPQYKSYSVQQNVRYYRNGGGGVKLYAGKTYTLSVADDNTTPAGIYMNMYGPNEASHRSVAYRYNAKSITYTPTEDVTIETDCYYVSAPAEGIENIKVQLEINDTATAYEPYQGEAKTITLTEPIYGADVDVTGGAGTEKYGIVDLGTLNWGYSSADARFYYNGIDYKRPASATDVANAKCTIYPLVKLGSLSDGTMCLYTNGYAYVKDTRYTDAASFKTAMSGHYLCYELATPTDLQTTPTDVELLTGVNNISADGDMELTIVDMIESGYYLKELPLEVTVTGAGNSGETTLVVERAEDFKEDAPDGTIHLGFDEEAVYQNVYGGEEQQIITSNDLISKFDDGCSYRIRASVKDGLGQTNKDSIDFTVRWEKQASEPTIEAEVVGDTARITVTKSASANEDDYCNIYRLSAGKPELIVEHGSFYDDTSEATEKATTYVDPYPTIGDYGYRAVLYTANGDYIIDATAAHGKKMAYSDAELTYESSAKTLIDFGDERVALDKNVDVSNTWSKDFQQTKYLGGSVTGDWNVGVLRSGSASAVAVTLIDMDEINSMSQLAEYVGECHIRTNSGDNFHADIQVSDTNSHDKAGFVRSYSMSLNKIDAQTLDGLTLEEWEGRNAVE